MITMCVYSLGTCILLIFFEKIPRPIREAALSVDVFGLMLENRRWVATLC